MKLLLAMLPTIVLVAYSQIVTKWRVNDYFKALTADASVGGRLWLYITDPWIISAYASALAGSAAWMLVVERHDLSLAFPVYVGLTVLVVTLLGMLIFDEIMNLQRALSIVFILTGVVFASRA